MTAFDEPLEFWRELINEVYKDGIPRKISEVSRKSVRRGAGIARTAGLSYVTNYDEEYLIIILSEDLKHIKNVADDTIKDGKPRKITEITADTIRIGARIAKANGLRFVKNYDKGFLIIAPPKEIKEITYIPKRRDIPQVIVLSKEQNEYYKNLRQKGIEYHKRRMRN